MSAYRSDRTDGTDRTDKRKNGAAWREPNPHFSSHEKCAAFCSGSASRLARPILQYGDQNRLFWCGLRCRLVLIVRAFCFEELNLDREFVVPQTLKIGLRC